MTALNLTRLVGNWVNTETRSQWIARIEVRDDDGRLLVNPFGPAAWGKCAATTVYATSVSSTEGAAWIADFQQSQVQALLNNGLLVVVACDGRRFTREFFRRSS